MGVLNFCLIIKIKPTDQKTRSTVQEEIKISVQHKVYFLSSGNSVRKIGEPHVK